MQTPDPDRRELLKAGLAVAVLPGAFVMDQGCSPVQDDPSKNACNPSAKKPEANNLESGSKTDSPKAESENTMQIRYLEIVTKEVDAVCASYAKLHGVTFGEADAGLGGARTAALPDGGMLGVRAPMHEAEEQVVRPYLLVNDIESAVTAAVESGAEIAHPPLKLPGHGTFAIFVQGGIQHGLWQV